MFSGIVERMGEVVEIRTDRQNKDFTLRADFCKELKIDQSIAHNGVCLTVVDIRDDAYTVTAMKETLDKSNLGLLKTGDLVNLERSMKPDALLDGHIVQGHVDQTAVCTCLLYTSTSCAASSSIETSRMRAERLTMPASTGADVYKRQVQSRRGSSGLGMR